MKRNLCTAVLALSMIVGVYLVCFRESAGHYSEYAVDEEWIENVTEGRTETTDLISELIFNEQTLIFDNATDTFFYSLIEGDLKADDPVIKVKSENADVKIGFLSERISEDGIRDNRSIMVMAYTDRTYCRYFLKCTTLPLMSIECQEEISDDAVEMKLTVFDNRRNAVNRVIFSDGEIHIRGGSTREFPKKGYRISLKQKSVGDNIRSNHVSLLGMRQDDDWLLYAGYNDQEKIRNVFSSNLWKYTCGTDNSRGTDTGMEYKYLELFINHEYWGLYALGYPIDEKQLEINGEKGDQVLYKKITWASEEALRFSESGNIDGYEIKSSTRVDGETEDLTGDWSLLSEYYNKLYQCPDDNDMLYSGIDIDNAIDIYLFFNLIQGHDNVRGPLIKNLYMTITNEHDRLTALYSPWDMDITWGNMWTEDVMANKVIPYGMPVDDNCIMESGYLNQLLDNGDDLIWEKVFRKYRRLRETGWSEENINSMLDEYEADIYGSGAYAREMERWTEGTYSGIVSRLDVFRDYVMKRLHETDLYYGRLEVLSDENALIRRSAQYKGFRESRFIIEINDRDLLNNADYVELFEYIGVDSSLITGEIRFAIVNPAEGKCEYLSALEDGMETCGGVISFSDNREEENAYTICLEGLPCLRVTDLPASGIRMIFVKDNRARAFDFY